MKKIDIKDLKGNAVSLFDDKWCLITAGVGENYNTMTASWGAMGELWNKDVCFCFIRPQRYTYEFTEKNELFTLSFFGEEYRKALSFCGTKSGRDFDKAKETGLTPMEIDGSVSFEESEIVIVLRKVAYQDINPEGFLDKAIDGNCYPQKDYHRMYIGEVVSCYVK
ncbi:MAG: flavin reductase family protein [Clostridia bacterium]|nr:flavin reductase family protein [Clostridia bacterium]